MSQPGEERGKGRYPRKRNDERREPPSVDGRTPPHAPDAEASVLSASMLSADALDCAITVLKPEHFYPESHRRIFEACLEVRATGEPVDVVLVAEWLKDRERIQQVGGMEYLAQIINAAPAVTSAHVLAYSRIIHEKWRVRQLIATCQKYAATGYIDYGDASSFIQSMSGEVERLTLQSGGVVFEAADAIMREDAVDDDEPDLLVPQLAIGPGRPGMLGGDSYTGKSVVAADIAVSVNTGVDVFGLMRVADVGAVRWLNYDQDPKLARRRIRRICRAKGVAIGTDHRFEIGHFPELHLDDDDSVQVLTRICRGFKLCVIDALIGSVIRTQEKDEAMGRVLLKLMHVSHKTGCAFLVIHHTIKPQGEYLGTDGKPFKGRRNSRPASAALRGNRAIFGSCDTVLLLESTGKKKPVRVVHEKAPHDGNTLDDFYLRFVDVAEPTNEFDDDAKKGRPKWGLRVEHLEPEQVETEREESKKRDPKKDDAEARANMEDVCERVLETLKTYPGSSGRAVKKLLPRVNHDIVDLALDTLLKRKLAAYEGGEKRGSKKLWRAV